MSVVWAVLSLFVLLASLGAMQSQILNEKFHNEKLPFIPDPPPDSDPLANDGNFVLTSGSREKPTGVPGARGSSLSTMWTTLSSMWPTGSTTWFYSSSTTPPATSIFPTIEGGLIMTEAVSSEPGFNRAPRPDSDRFWPNNSTGTLGDNEPALPSDTDNMTDQNFMTDSDSTEQDPHSEIANATTVDPNFDYSTTEATSGLSHEGGNQSLQQGGNQSLQQGGNQSLQEDENQSLQQGGNQSLQQGGNQSLQEDENQSLQQGGNQSLQQGGNQSLQEGGNQSLQEGGNQSPHDAFQDVGNGVSEVSILFSSVVLCMSVCSILL